MNKNKPSSRTISGLESDSDEVNTMKLLLTRQFVILLDDTGRTGNINMHSYWCFAISEDEAVGKMHRERPEFRNRQIQLIKSI